MNKSLEKIRDIKSLINEVYQDELNEGARKSWLVFQQYCDDIKQDLELLEQLKQQRDSLAINNGELVVKVADLQKENQELKEKLELTETARQLLYNELKCCNGISEYAQKLEKAIEKEIETLIERRSDAYYAEEDEVYRELNIIIEELKEVIKNEN